MSAPHYPARTPLDAYGGGSFRFAGSQHPGSLLILPSGMHGWRPASLSDVQTGDLDLLLAEREGIGMLLLGTGPAMGLVPGPLRDALRAANIGLEAMDTGAAVRTYNILLAENRPVAAALLVVP